MKKIRTARGCGAVVIMGFPGNKFSGRASAIMELVERATIRVINLLFVMKDADGFVTTIAAADLDRTPAEFPRDRHRPPPGGSWPGATGVT